MSSPTPEVDDSTQQSFSISLTVYSKIKKTSVKGKTTSKEEKSTKMKELLFAPNNSNYVEFLQAILLKHGLEIYEVTEKKHFPLKYIPPKAKAYIFHDGGNGTNFSIRQRVTDAIDVDNVSDYKEMVKKITNEKPSIVKVFVDTRHINKLPRGSTTRGSRSSEDDSGATTDSVRVCTIFTSTWNVANIYDYRKLVVQRKQTSIVVLHDGA